MLDLLADRHRRGLRPPGHGGGPDIGQFNARSAHEGGADGGMGNLVAQFSGAFQPIEITAPFGTDGRGVIQIMLVEILEIRGIETREMRGHLQAMENIVCAQVVHFVVCHRDGYLRNL